MQGTEMMTVEEWILNELLGRRLRLNEAKQALAFAKTKLDAINYQVHATMSRKQASGVLVQDCWNTSSAEYEQEDLDGLLRLIEHHTFTWLVNQLRSRS